MRSAVIIGIAFAALSIAAAQRSSPLEQGIFRVLNQFRADPAPYASVLKQRRQYYQGKLLAIPGQPRLITREGIRPLDETIATLQHMHVDLGRVTLSSGLSRAAADHVADTGPRGITSHKGADGSDFTKRITRYGTWSGEVGEEISYGASEAREVLIDLLIDDGVPDRGHRRSLLDPRWRYVGIACGPHATYGTMCVMDFATSFTQK